MKMDEEFDILLDRGGENRNFALEERAVANTVPRVATARRPALFTELELEEAREGAQVGRGVARHRDPPMRQNTVLGRGTFGSEFVDQTICREIGLNSDIVNSLFSPYMSKILKRCPDISHCKLDRFIHWFKLDSDILRPMQEYIWNHPKGKNAVLAGGKMMDFFQNKKIEESLNDYDLFVTDESMEYWLDERLTKGLRLKSNGVFSHVIEYGATFDSLFSPLDVQVVTSIYAGPEHVLENFDIRACAIACDGEYVYWAKGALRDQRNKKLVMLNPKSNMSVWNRILKYVQRGYEISTPDLAIVCVRFLDAVASPPLVSQDRMYNRDFVFDRVNELQRTEVYDALGEM